MNILFMFKLDLPHIKFRLNQTYSLNNLCRYLCKSLFNLKDQTLDSLKSFLKSN